MILASIRFHVQRVDKELRVLGNDAIVIVRAYQVWMLLRLLVLRDKLCSHVRRPKVSWSRLTATKPLLELRGVEHLDESCRGTIWREHNFRLCLLVNER